MTDCATEFNDDLSSRPTSWSLCLMAVLFLSSCQNTTTVDDSTQSRAAPERATQQPQSGNDADTEPNIPSLDIPLPSEIAQSDTKKRAVDVSVSEDFATVEKYLRSALVDYEVFKRGRNLKAIPLRKNMPEIRVKSFGRKTSITYIKPVAEQPSTDESSSSESSERPIQVPDDRLPNGSH